MFLCNQYPFVALAFVTTLLKTTCQVRPHCFAPQFGNHILFIDRVHICMRVRVRVRETLLLGADLRDGGI